MVSFRFGVAIVVCTIVLTLVPVARAAAQSALPDRYEFLIGGFDATFGTVIGLKAAASDNVPLVDFERDLGAPDHDTVFRASGAVRFGKHQFRVGYYKTSRESTRRLERQIVWGDQTFNIGASVDVSFSTSFPEADYTYWVASSSKAALGATVGVTQLGVKAGVTAAVNDRSTSAQIDTSAPVPLVGLEFRGLPAAWLLVRGGGGYVTDFSGVSVWRLGGGIEPRIYKNLWLGVSLDAIKFNLSKDGSLLRLNAAGSYRVSGVQFYVRLGF